MIISAQKLAGDKIKYNGLLKNTKTEQENTRENTKKTTEINWVDQKRFPH